MNKIKLDVKDMKMLDILDRNSTISLVQLAKSTGISPQVAEYRLKRLVAQKTIWGFFALVDPGRLGYSLFRIHIKLKNVSEQAYTAFAETLLKQYPTFWVAFISGSFDIMTDIWAKNARELNELFQIIVEGNKEIIDNYEILPILEIDIYQYGFLFKERTEREYVQVFQTREAIQIDEIDKKILRIIKDNARMPFDKIGQYVGLTRNAVKYRIRHLEEKKVIAGYKMMIDFRHFDRSTYKIFIKYSNAHINQERELLAFVKSYPGILAHVKILGRWNLDIEIEPRDAKELQKFLITLRNRFPIVESYEFIQVLQDYGIDYYPDKLK